VVANPFVVGGADPAVATVRVLVVPHAGAGAASTLPFRQHAPANWLVAGARLPGRESRYAEPVTDLAGLVADVVASARALPGSAPLLVVGVCSGAVIGVRAVRELQRADPGSVGGFVAVSQWAVDEPPDPRSLPLRGADEPARLLAGLRAFGAIPDGVDDDDLLHTYLPVIVADVRAVEGQHVDPEPRLGCPVLVVAGDHDDLCSPAAVAGWSRYSDRTREVRVPGGHMLLLDSAAVLVDAIAANVDHFYEGVRP
jgi:surfactin synthase thioesterase subunit